MRFGLLFLSHPQFSYQEKIFQIKTLYFPTRRKDVRQKCLEIILDVVHLYCIQRPNMIEGLGLSISQKMEYYILVFQQLASCTLTLLYYDL